MKKFIISLIILILFAGAIFILGWLEFFVPVDKIGVMITKTGGVRHEVIQAGNLSWSWERLIPTNSEIRVFSVTPQPYSKTIKGSLPSSEIYKNMLEGNPSFNYNFSVSIVFNLKPNSLPAYIEKTGAKEQSDLDAYLEQQVNSIAQTTINYVINESVDNVDFVVQMSLTDSELITGINASSKYPDLNITSIQINNVTLPDLTMYNHAKNSYAAYQAATQRALEESFELQGFDAAQDYFELERLSKLGRVLADYPNLIDYMAVTNGNTNFELPNDIPQIRELSQ